MVLTTLFAGSLFSGYYYLKTQNDKVANAKFDKTFMYDPQFSQQNIPLYHKQAKIRDQMLQKLRYELFLVLSKGETFEGKVVIDFYLGDKDKEELFLDFQGVGVTDLHINESKIRQPNINFTKHRIYLPAYNLKSNQMNRVSIRFTNKYVTNSAGFHRYEDPADGEVYLYTHLEPFFCHRWFPCFDQPSLRAPFKLTVVTPDPKWQVISNDDIRQTLSLDSMIAKSILSQEHLSDALERLQIPENGQLILFETSAPISTYIYALAAGPYCSFNNETDFHVPMKIYCRKSKVQFADVKERFRTIEIAVKFFEDFFQTPFPFKKYDQVFIPEFRISGMENPGCIMMRDSFMRPDDEKSFFEYQQWYKVSVHELSHMWFGDLVTMRWWNDLWLKESFAEYSASVCLTECEEFKHVKEPEQFALHFLTEALNEDTRKTTHPVQVTVNHTNDAVNAYNKICYRKGAAFLRQMDQFLGREIMRDGIKIYFDKNQFKITTLQDFIDSLQIALTKREQDFNLQEWTDSWLTKSGVNELIPEVDKRGGRLAYTIHINQSFPRYGDQVHHEQILDVAIYDKDCNQKIYKDIRIAPEAQSKDVVSGLEKAPSAILINANNKGYCRTILDSESLKFFLANLSKIKDTLNRTYIWRILCDNLKIKVVKPEQFIKCIEDHFVTETEEYTMSTTLTTLQYVLRYLTPSESRPQVISKLEKIFLQKLEVGCPTLSMEILLLQELFSMLLYVQSDQVLQWYKDSQIKLNKKIINLKKEQRYQLLKLIFRNPTIEAEYKQELLEKEKQQEFSDFDIIEEFGCQASLPGSESKFNLWDKYVQGSSFNVKGLEASSKFLYDYSNIPLCLEIADHFYDTVESVFAMHHRDYANQFFMQLSPTFLGRQSDLDKLRQIFEKQKESENTHFVNLLNNEIELFEMNIDINSTK